MPQASQRDAPGPLKELDADVVLIDECGPDERLEAIFAESGLSHRLAGGVAELIEGEAAPYLVVLRTEETLTKDVVSVLEQVGRRWPQTAVVAVCAEIRPGELRAALAVGISGVVLEDELTATMPACIAAARSGQLCLPKRHARQVEPAALSTREKQILGLVVMGYMNSEIGERLFVAESTVKSHLSSAFAKLGVRSRNEAVELILDPERGLGTGILALGGERVELKATAR